MRGLEALVVFLVWWAVWSLLDAVLLKFTPCSELAVLAVAFIVWWCLGGRNQHSTSRDPPRSGPHVIYDTPLNPSPRPPQPQP